VRRRSWLVLLCVAIAPLAADELVKTRWSVDEKGDIWVHPPEPGENEQPIEPFRLFGRGAQPNPFGLETGLLDRVASAGLARTLTLYLPGALDLASQTDGDEHFRKLGLPTADGDVLARLEHDPERTGALGRRDALDRLLAVRLAGERRLKEAVAALCRLAEDPDPFVSRAARQSLAAIAGQHPPPAPALEPLAKVLAALPAEAGLVVVIDQSRVPAWGEVPRLMREHGMRRAQRQIEALGAAVAPLDYLHGQVALDADNELPYEIVRRLGNARADRSVFALTDQGAYLVVEGRFEPARISAGLRELGCEPKTVDGAVRVTFDLEVPCVLAVGERRLELAVNPSATPGGEALARELTAAGAGGTDAVWCHVRDAKGLPYVPEEMKGFVRGTLTVSFEGGVRATLETTWTDANRAKGFGNLLAAARMAVPVREAAELLAKMNLRTDGATCIASLRLPGISVAELTRRFTAPPPK